MKYNRSEIMRRAWEIKRKNTDCTFSECLKKSWAIAKEDLVVETTLQKAVKKAQALIDSNDYRLTWGVDREVKTFETTQNGEERVYIGIRCYTMAGNYKGNYKCGYIVKATDEYVSGRYDKFNLFED